MLIAFRVLFLYLNKVAELRGKDENIGGEWHLTEALELLIIHVHVLHRRVERVEAETNTWHLNYIVTSLARKGQGNSFGKSYLLWVSMCFSMRENRSDPVPLQHNNTL